MEVGRCEELTEIVVADVSTPAMAVKTELRTGLKCGLVMNLDTGWDFDVAKH